MIGARNAVLIGPRRGHHQQVLFQRHRAAGAGSGPGPTAPNARAARGIRCQSAERGRIRPERRSAAKRPQRSHSSKQVAKPRPGAAAGAAGAAGAGPGCRAGGGRAANAHLREPRPGPGSTASGDRRSSRGASVPGGQHRLCAARCGPRRVFRPDLRGQRGADRRRARRAGIWARGPCRSATRARNRCGLAALPRARAALPAGACGGR